MNTEIVVRTLGSLVFFKKLSRTYLCPRYDSLSEYLPLLSIAVHGMTMLCMAYWICYDGVQWVTQDSATVWNDAFATGSFMELFKLLALGSIFY